MKKILFFLLALCAAFSLTSCQVNWFGGTIDVPWYVVVVPVVLLFVVVYIAIITGTYVCPKCGTEFKPRWYEISACTHFNGKRLVKCPTCGRRGFCRRKR
ncbi:MAG: hypothetical protein IJF49_01050 [Clostridia bacterium]|nr:hypothetical protein [Clostridia bacterium]